MVLFRFFLGFVIVDAVEGLIGEWVILVSALIGGQVEGGEYEEAGHAVPISSRT